MMLSMPASDPVSTLHTRPSLLFRLKDWEDETSWLEFYRLYHNFIYGLARRSGLSHADAEEVTQDVFRGVAQKIQDFESDPRRGTFRGWLAQRTRWRIAEKYRNRRPEERQPNARREDAANDRTRTIERVPDGAGGAPWGEPAAEEVEWQRHVLDTALMRLGRRVPAKHFQLFDLYARQNWTVMRVARAMGVSPATVYVVSHRLTKQLKREVAQLEKQLR